MKATFESINEFSAAAAGYLTRLNKAETKLSHAIKKITNQLVSVINQREIERDDINREYADSDDKLHLIFDERGNYCYTKEQQKDRLNAMRKLDASKLYDIEPYYATELPDDLTDFEKEKFSGWVIPATEAVSNGKSQKKSSSL